MVFQCIHSSHFYKKYTDQKYKKNYIFLDSHSVMLTLTILTVFNTYHKITKNKLCLSREKL